MQFIFSTLPNVKRQMTTHALSSSRLTFLGALDGSLGDSEVDGDREVEPAGGSGFARLVRGGLEGDSRGGFVGNFAQGGAEGSGLSLLDEALDGRGFLGFLGLGLFLAAGFLAELLHLGLELHAHHEGHNVEHLE